MHLRIEGETLESGLTHLTFKSSDLGLEYLMAVKQALHDLEAVHAPLEVWGTPILTTGPTLTVTLPVFHNGKDTYGQLTELVAIEHLTQRVLTPAPSFRKSVWIEQQISPRADTEIAKSAAVTYYPRQEWHKGIRCFGLTHMWPWATLSLYARGSNYKDCCKQLANRLTKWVNASEKRIPLRCIQHGITGRDDLVLHIAMYCYKPSVPHQLMMWDQRPLPCTLPLQFWKGYEKQGSLVSDFTRQQILNQGCWPINRELSPAPR